jgi:hypothetical protein
MHTTTITPSALDRHASERLLGVLAAPFQARTWRATGYNLVGLFVGVVWFTVIVTGFALGAGLLVTLVGAPILVLTLIVARIGALTERWRASWIDGRRLPAPVQPDPQTLSWAGFKAQLRHAKSWTSALYLVALLPVGIATFTIALTTWAYAAAALTMPFWNDTISNGHARLLGYTVQRPIDYLPVLAAGAVAFFLAPWINRATAQVNTRLVQVLAAGRPS